MPILWPPDVKSWLIWKDPDTGKDWGREEKGAAEDMVWWHHWLSGHEFEQTRGDNGGQSSLACCSPWGLKDADTIYWLNNNNNNNKYLKKIEAHPNVNPHVHKLHLVPETQGLKEWHLEVGGAVERRFICKYGWSKIFNFSPLWGQKH